MITKIINGITHIDEAANESIRVLKSGEPVCFPTDTVYGIGALINDYQAVNKIYKIKDRDYSKPLTAHLFDIIQVREVAEYIPDEFEQLASRFLPGALTIILKKKKNLPIYLNPGFENIGIRIPNNNIFLEIAKKANTVIVATSANLSGKEDSSSAEDVLKQLNGKTQLLIDGGKIFPGISSTVIDLSQKPFKVIRKGAIDISQISDVIPDIMY